MAGSRRPGPGGDSPSGASRPRAKPGRRDRQREDPRPGGRRPRCGASTCSARATGLSIGIDHATSPTVQAASDPPERPGNTIRTGARHGAGARGLDRRTGRTPPARAWQPPASCRTHNARLWITVVGGMGDQSRAGSCWLPVRLSAARPGRVHQISDQSAASAAFLKGGRQTPVVGVEAWVQDGPTPRVGHAG
jgi:hypothetical protein